MTASVKITEMIAKLSTPAYEWIPKRALIIESLNELNAMVGMDDLKLEILRMAKAAILGCFSKTNDMYHTVLTGNPGVGKTAVAMILCKILVGLGLVKKRASSSREDESDSETLDTSKVTKHPAYKHLEDMYGDLHRYAHDEHQKALRFEEVVQQIQARLADQRFRLLGSRNFIVGKKRDYEVTPKTPNSKRARFEECLGLISYHSYDVDQEGAFCDHVGEALASRHESSGSASLIPFPDRPTYVRRRVVRKNTTPSVQSQFRIICGHDMVGQYVGQTGPKMKALLESCRGKVVFVDEAYKLHDNREGAGDFLGLALTMIIEWMDKHRDETTFIFAGYAEMLRKTIFKIQPGLKRRCQWIFNIESYTPEQLFEIFEIKRRLTSLVWDPRLKPSAIIEILDINQHTFTAAGGDMEQLVFQCGLMAKELYFDSTEPPVRLPIPEVSPSVLETPPSSVRPPIPEDVAGVMASLDEARPKIELTITKEIFNAAIKRLKTRNEASGECHARLSKETIQSMYI